MAIRPLGRSRYVDRKRVSTTRLMCFRRDLRLADNPAWNAATSRHERVVALFVIDPQLFRRNTRRSEHLLHQLRALDDELAQYGGRLLVRSGLPDTLVAAEAAASNSTAVYWNRDVSPYSVRRDATVAASLPCQFDAWFGSLVHALGRIRTAAAEPYRVFTPFYRRWLETPWDPWPQPGEAEVATDVGEGIPEPGGAAMAAPGAAAARDRLDTFARRVAEYPEQRNRPDWDSTSRLSIDLKYGTLSPRAVIEALAADEAAAAFVRQLAWRDFYAHVLEAFPHTTGSG